ncbi:hypothetical protein [Limnoraphis robusta]|uniref:Uncharacterized protein n=1 Tax=Limnoraphis robusta CS-951 TaxID=1637645 RepID=A0A0F5Y8Y2_9CYAN|nr:hypothetical protein [Limnoraphis robusta]KKD34670.1 hypothetical protein WN50_29565 [Limnoraphis robusta CS-951]
MRYLLYKNYESGLNNDLMSLELAVGLAYLTKRRLVYYGSAGEQKQLKPVAGGLYNRVPEHRKAIINNQRIPTILDLLDPMPIEWITYSEFLAENHLNTLSLSNCDLRLVNAVFVPNHAVVIPDVLEEFAENRLILRDVQQDIWHLSQCNFGFYSRFFYLPHPSLYTLMESIRPHVIYRNLADKISYKLGRFNGIHVRLTDYRKHIPGIDKCYSQKILSNIKANFPRNELLVICTDESDKKHFFTEIMNYYKNHLFIDEFIINEFVYDFKDLPFTDEQTLGLICNLVMAKAAQFAGTLRSTYTGIIHRNWLRNRLNINPDISQLDFQYIDSGFDGQNVDFQEGFYPEKNTGLFSWNRIQFPVSPEGKSWYREWPESVVVSI